MKTILHYSQERLRNSNLTKSSSKVSLLAMVTLAISVGATNLEATNVLEFKDTHQEVVASASAGTLKLLNMVSKTTNDNNTVYIQHRINQIASCINTTSPSLSSEQQDAVLKQISSTPQFEGMLAAILEQKVKANGYTFVLKNSPISSYLSKAHLADVSYCRVNGYDIYQGKKAVVNDEINNTFKNAVAQHLFNKLKIYVPTNKIDTSVANLLPKQGLEIFTHLKEVKDANRYVKFADLQDTKDLNITKHHIVITDTEMANAANKTALQAFLASNNNHELVLNVGDDFVQDGTLVIRTRYLPDNLRHLTITNSSGNVTTIGDGFLYNFRGLISFDSSGFTNVTTIKGTFFYECPGLTSFDSSGFTNVTTIGEGFLSQCKGLTSVDGSEFMNVTDIGGGFLNACMGLISLDSTEAQKELFQSKMNKDVLKQITWNIKG